MLTINDDINVVKVFGILGNNSPIQRLHLMSLFKALASGNKLRRRDHPLYALNGIDLLVDGLSIKLAIINDPGKPDSKSSKFGTGVDTKLTQLRGSSTILRRCGGLGGVRLVLGSVLVQSLSGGLYGGLLSRRGFPYRGTLDIFRVQHILHLDVLVVRPGIGSGVGVLVLGHRLGVLNFAHSVDN